MASAGQFRKVQEIVTTDAGRRYVVNSAPGKRYSDDQKITDLLYLSRPCKAGQAFDDIFTIITNRYLEIIHELGLSLDLRGYLAEIKTKIAAGATADYAASRGEFLGGLILAELLGYDFIDAAEIIFFNANGTYDPERTGKAVSERLAQHPRAVIPGFYGTLPNGGIKTFPRGGSDITGAIIARWVQAAVYENWTDVSGFLMADPGSSKNETRLEDYLPRIAGAGLYGRRRPP